MVHIITNTKAYKAGSVEEFATIAKSNRKEFIKSAVKGFKEMYPRQYKSAVDRAKELRLTRNNAFALADKDMDMRFGVTLPAILDKFIRFNLPDFCEGKEMKWFMDTFPQFKVPEKY